MPKQKLSAKTDRERNMLAAWHLEAGRLVEVLPGWGPPPGILHAVFPSRRALVPAIRKLIDFLAEHVGAGGFKLTV